MQVFFPRNKFSNKISLLAKARHAMLSRAEASVIYASRAKIEETYVLYNGVMVGQGI